MELLYAQRAFIFNALQLSQKLVDVVVRLIVHSNDSPMKGFATVYGASFFAVYANVFVAPSFMQIIDEFCAELGATKSQLDYINGWFEKLFGEIELLLLSRP